MRGYGPARIPGQIDTLTLAVLDGKVCPDFAIEVLSESVEGPMGELAKDMIALMHQLKELMTKPYFSEWPKIRASKLLKISVA